MRKGFRADISPQSLFACLLACQNLPGEPDGTTNCSCYSCNTGNHLQQHQGINYFPIVGKIMCVCIGDVITLCRNAPGDLGQVAGCQSMCKIPKNDRRYKSDHWHGQQKPGLLKDDISALVRMPIMRPQVRMMIPSPRDETVFASLPIGAEWTQGPAIRSYPVPNDTLILVRAVPPCCEGLHWFPPDHHIFYCLGRDHHDLTA